MKKSDVIAYFDGNQAAAGRAIGVSRQTVNSWGDVIPELPARRYHDVTHGELAFDPNDYERPRKAS